MIPREAVIRQLAEDIDLFWQYVANAYDIEPREYFEREARLNGFKSPLAQAAHHIWKRDPKVVSLAQSIREDDAQIVEAFYAKPVDCALVEQIVAAIRARQEPR